MLCLAKCWDEVVKGEVEVPHPDLRQARRLDRRLLVRPLSQGGDDPLPVAQQGDLQHLEERETKGSEH